MRYVIGIVISLAIAAAAGFTADRCMNMPLGVGIPVFAVTFILLVVILLAALVWVLEI